MSRERRIEFLAEFIKESESIAGIENNANFLKKEIGGGKKNGHVGALLYAEECAQGKRVLSEDNIRFMQGLILGEQDRKSGVRVHPAMIGVYRNVRLRGEFEDMPPPSDVPTRMRELHELMEGFLNNHGHYNYEVKIIKISGLHFHLLKIHPFGDGNGRTARILAYYLFRFCGLKPFIFTLEDKWERYYAAFDDRTGKKMSGYFLKKALL